LIAGLKRTTASFLPDFLKGFFRKLFGTRKRAAIYLRGARGQKVTKQYLVEKLRELGLKRGAVVAVHSSLSRLGFVEGGAKTVVDALIEAVGERGTILMPTFTGFSETAKSNAFDVRKTRSRVGAVTEAFRKMPGVKRSVHPTHSCAALGPKADFLLEGQEEAPTLFGEGTPFHKLMEVNGFVLCLGIGIGMMSMYHVAEDITLNFPLKVYRPGKEKLPVVDWSGNKRNIETAVHDVELHDKFSVDEPLFERELAKRGALKSLRIGESSSSLMPAKKVTMALKDMAARGRLWYREV